MAASHEVVERSENSDRSENIENDCVQGASKGVQNVGSDVKNVAGDTLGLPKTDDSGLDVLRACVSNLETSVSVSMTRLTQSLSNSMNMVKSMNGMMEDYMKQSLVIKCKFRAQDVHHVEARLKNTGRICISDMSVKIALTKNEKGETEEFLLDKLLIRTLDPGQEIGWCSHHLPNSPSWSSIVTTGEFPSPGTGQPLSVKSVTPLFLCERIALRRLSEPSSITTLDDITRLENRYSRASVPAKVAREFLRVAPLEGIEVPSVWSGEYPSKANSVVYVLVSSSSEKIANDAQIATVDIIFFSAEADQASLDSICSDLAAYSTVCL